jgi:biopolymer transport protein ExbD
MQDARKMKTRNNNNNRKMPLLRSIPLVATIVILTIIFASTTTLVSASTTGNTTTTTTTSVGGGEQEAVSSTTTTTSDASNALLGRLFSYDEGEDVESNVNPVNETYIVISYSGNRIILPPNATDIINATETGNVTINIQPSGLSFNQGHAVIMTEDGAEGGENATISFVLLSRTNPDGSGSGTSVTYFSTNSTGQLAFLDDLVAIGQVEYSPAEGINRFAEWEWKGGTLPFENLIPQP